MPARQVLLRDCSRRVAPALQNYRIGFPAAKSAQTKTPCVAGRLVTLVASLDGAALAQQINHLLGTLFHRP